MSETSDILERCATVIARERGAGELADAVRALAIVSSMARKQTAVARAVLIGLCAVPVRREQSEG